MASTSAMALSGSAVAASNRLSCSAAFGSSSLQKLTVVRPAAKALRKCGESRASLNDDEERSKPQMLVAIVAAGAALALNVGAPVSPAVAGLFDRGASSEFPGKEGTGNKVGQSSDVRGLAGTPFGEGAGNVVGDNSATRALSSSGTPLGEGSSGGSGVNVGELVQGAPDVGGAVADAKKSATDIAGDVKSKLPGGN